MTNQRLAAHVAALALIVLLAGCSQSAEPADRATLDRGILPAAAPQLTSVNDSAPNAGREPKRETAAIPIPRTQQLAAAPTGPRNPLRDANVTPAGSTEATKSPAAAEQSQTAEQPQAEPATKPRSLIVEMPTLAPTQTPGAPANGPLLFAPADSQPSRLELVPPQPRVADQREPDSNSAVLRTAKRGDSAYASHGESKPDPVQLNGPIFVDWPKPLAAIVITGDQLGYIEPCGCAGLENQKGGLSRRHTLIKQLREQGWPVVPVDLGNVVERLGKQAEIKFGAAIQGMRLMDYAAVGLGVNDLRLPAGILVTVATEQGASPFVSANVGLFGFDTGFTRRWTAVEAAGRRIGVTSVLGDAERAQLAAGDGLVLEEAAASLRGILPELKAASDFRVLLSDGQPEEAKALAAQFPDFDVVVTTAGAEEPPNAPQTVPGSKALFIEVGQKGMFAIVLGLFDDPQQPIRYQRVPLDARFDDSAEMQDLKTQYQLQLQTLGWEGLELSPKRHPRATKDGDLAAQFAGTQACADCHTKAFDVWKESPHAHATDTLVKLAPPRQFDAECISCHATGWNPPGYFPYIGGFDSLKSTAHLAQNGCENCHGPGAAHVAAETGDADATAREQLRQMMRVALGTAANNSCTQCHDHDNSPDFDLDAYWPQIEHTGKD